MNPHIRRTSAFTLIELLVVVAIIALLISILIPSLAQARRQARRMKCGANMHQLWIAFEQYAAEHNGIYTPSEKVGADSLQHLRPWYLPDVELAICPSTKNVLFRRDPAAGRGVLGLIVAAQSTGPTYDLTTPAQDARDDRGGHSYETFGWMFGPVIYPDGRAIDGSGSRLSIQAFAGVLETRWPGCLLKLQHNLKKPHQEFILTDSDQAGASEVPRSPGNLHNNYPDEPNNHGTAGANVAFLDGHVQWVRQADFRRVYHNGYHVVKQSQLNHQLTGEPLSPGLTVTETQRNGKMFWRLAYE